ncbi:MAG: hypothetical protein ACOCV2_01595 [Persicimonas sp.]
MKLPVYLTTALACCLLFLGSGCGTDDNNDNASSNASCAHGETRKEDCNTCACSQQGAWSCTEINCQNVRDAGDGGYADIGDECEPGQTKKVDCNTCGCDKGRWVCTEIACADAGSSDTDADR